MNKLYEQETLPILTIAVMASILQCHQRTLRIYDKEGILCPKRTSKNRRRYGLLDVKKSKIILFLTRNLGINIAGIKIIFSLLKKDNLNLENIYDLLKKVALKANINEEMQKNNIKKSLKRGRSHTNLF